jgi:sugar (pentulose or hexulose) kinase
LRLFGGGARSASWAQIIADACQKPVVVFSIPEMGCLGAAMLAGIGAGLFAGPDEAAALVRIRRRIEPRSELSAMYAEQYQEYLEIQRRMTAAPAS